MNFLPLTEQQFETMAKARASLAKALIIEAMPVPDGYELSDDQSNMIGNAFLRLRPLMNRTGKKSVHFFHSISYRSQFVDGKHLKTPTNEYVWACCDTYTDKEVWSRDGVAFGEKGRLNVMVNGRSISDLGIALKVLIARSCTFPPFVEFNWRICAHDAMKLELLNLGVKVASVWQSGRQWATLMGSSFLTKNQAKHETQVDVASGIYATNYGRCGCLPGFAALIAQDRILFADQAFQDYSFGEDVQVTDTEGWEHDGSGDLIRKVYVEFNDGGPDRVSFHVRFRPSTSDVEEVYGLLMSNGTYIGLPSQSLVSLSATDTTSHSAPC